MIQRALRLEGEICGVETIVLGASSHALIFLILLQYKVLLTRSCNGVPSSTIGDQVLSVWSRATCSGNLPYSVAGWSWRIVAGAVLSKRIG
jgi:hypothetical protein